MKYNSDWCCWEKKRATAIEIMMMEKIFNYKRIIVKNYLKYCNCNSGSHATVWMKPDQAQLSWAQLKKLMFTQITIISITANDKTHKPTKTTRIKRHLTFAMFSHLPWCFRNEQLNGDGTSGFHPTLRAFSQKSPPLLLQMYGFALFICLFIYLKSIESECVCTAVAAVVCCFCRLTIIYFYESMILAWVFAWFFS